MKCYYILLSKEGIIYNIGSYIILSIIFIYMILSIRFWIKEYKSFLYKINKIIIEKKEIENNQKILEKKEDNPNKVKTKDKTNKKRIIVVRNIFLL